METPNIVFQVDSKLVNDTFNQSDNYLIEYSPKTATDQSDKICVIYFSSNDIYYPNNSETFCHQIIEKNKFEWYQTRIETASKHIFVRDIFKQWYLKGINGRLNSVEKVTDFLKNETEGYCVITLGSSAGGYAAVLFGTLLNARAIYSFNGQFTVYDLITPGSKKYSSEQIDPVLFREKNNPEINCYYTLRPYIKHPEKIFYFHSMYSLWDKMQFDHVSDLGIRFVSFKTSHHGIPFPKTNLKNLINYNPEKIKKFAGKAHHPFFFSIQIDGFVKTCRDISLILLRHFSKKLKTK